MVMEIADTGRVLKEEELHLRGEEQGKRKGWGLHICNQLAEPAKTS
jgi:hypothetical protein